MFDWAVKRSVRRFLGAYAKSRSGGAAHREALQVVLHSDGSLTIQERASVWMRFQRPEPIEPDGLREISSSLRIHQHQSDFARLVFLMLHEDNGPWDRAPLSRVTTVISKTIRDNPIKWD